MTFARTMLAVVTAAACLAAQSKQKKASSPPREEARKTIAVDGVTRSYLVVQAQQPTRAMPLFLFFHGPSSTGAEAAESSRFPALPGSKGAVLVFPDAIKGQWSYGAPGEAAAAAKNDIAFVRALIQQMLKSNPDLDRTRVFAAGVLTGGAFALRLGCEISGDLAAVASIGAGLAPDVQSKCKPPDGMPVLLLDNKTLAEAGAAQAAFDHWRKANACTGEPSTEEVKEPPPHTVQLARPCKDGSEVRYLRGEQQVPNWRQYVVREIVVFCSRFRRAPKF